MFVLPVFQESNDVEGAAEAVIVSLTTAASYRYS